MKLVKAIIRTKKVEDQYQTGPAKSHLTLSFP